MSELTAQLTTALSDHYRLERHLGEGGMATVYLAHDVKHDRKVALKVLRPELAALIGAERFLNEIKVTANLQHPHILPLHDSGTVEVSGNVTLLYYVMPFVEGESLREKLTREKQLAISDAVEITRAVAGALDYAHRQGVIHRDIKPENVLIHDGQPTIADFGIALAVSQAGGSRLTETGLSMGTPHYMSPEQAMGDRELDARTDIYSLGAMLYEMLAGDPPYTGSTAQAVVAKVITEKPPLITTARDTVPPHVAAAVHRALEKLPADRFNSAAKFAAALADTSFSSPSVGVTAAAPRPAPQRSPYRYAWPGAFAVLAVVAAWGWLRPAAPQAVSRYEITLPPDQALATATIRMRLALAPDGSRFVYVGNAPNGGTQLYLRNRNQLASTALAGTEGAVNPSMSPDGSRVAFVTTSPPRALKVVSLDGGPPLTLTDSLVDEGGVSWGYDGYIYFDGHLEGDGVVRIRESGGAPQPMTMRDSAQGELWHSAPTALPNGQGLLFKIARPAWLSQDFDLAVLDLETGEYRVLFPGVSARYAPSGHLVYVTPDGTLMAQPFDQRRLETTGEPIPVTDGLSVRFLGMTDLALSNDGSLMYVTGANTGSNPTQLVLVDRDGTVEPLDLDRTGMFESVALSPDGTRLAVSYVGADGVKQDIWTARLDQGTLQRISFEGSNNRSPLWSPDGQRIAYVSDQSGSDLLWFERPANGGAAARRLTTSDALATAGTFSPDGEWIVYGTFAGKIVGIPLDSGRATDLVVSPAGAAATPAISPDGRWLAYASNESGQWEVYVVPFPSGDGKWLVSRDGGMQPKWAHSGNELYYLAPEDLMAVDVDPGPSFSFGNRRVLFPLGGRFRVSSRPGGQYDVAKDDQRFLMIQLASGNDTPEALVVVENFLEELQQRFRQ